MQDKFEHFNQLPNVIKGAITKFLPTTEFLNLAMTSKGNHDLFSTNKYLAPLAVRRHTLPLACPNTPSKTITASQCSANLRLF